MCIVSTDGKTTTSTEMLSSLGLDVTNLFQEAQRRKERLNLSKHKFGADNISPGANGEQRPSTGSELQVFGLFQTLVVRVIVVP